MMNTSKLAAKLRQRRNFREFQRALNTASPAMQQELMAAAARQTMLNR
jgi:hypothetical protein